LKAPRIGATTCLIRPAGGVSSVRLGTGRVCTVCRRRIDSPTLEREVEGPGVVGRAHPACYVIWREESLARKRKPT